MGRLSAAPIALLLAAAIAVGLSACGSSPKLLPGNTASAIKSNLEDVRHLVEEGECPGAADAADAVSIQIEQLTDVDGKLKSALAEGASRLNEVVHSCHEASEEAEAQEGEEEEPEAEEEEKPAKAKKPKPEKEKQPPEEAAEPPKQEEEKGKGEAPPEETGGGAPSGGVGPGGAAEGE